MRLRVLHPSIVGIECEEMDEVTVFKYPRSVMCKHDSREEYLRKKHCKEEGWQVPLATMNGRGVSMEIKNDLRSNTCKSDMGLECKSEV